MDRCSERGDTCSSDFFHHEFDYKLFDDQGCMITATVWYERGHMNAHWPSRQITFGEGHFHLLTDFHSTYNILAHELTRGIIMRTSGLNNTRETGALSEHLADVFGIPLKQQRYSVVLDAKHLWAIGESLFGGLALDSLDTALPKDVAKERSNFAKFPRYLPSFAHPESTKPPQPTHYDELERNINYDNGGVHLICGIADHAFCIAASAAVGPPLTRRGSAP
jgi:Zn-dependent metalloprotease